MEPISRPDHLEEPKLELEIIAWGSPQYEEALLLRDRVLRRPLGMDIINDDLQGEREDLHFTARLEGRVAGVLLLRRSDPHTLQMKQVAVDEAARGRNIGRALVEYAEAAAVSRGCREITLHARQSAVPFYEKLGYSVTGEPFTEIGLPHRHMTKRL